MFAALADLLLCAQLIVSHHRPQLCYIHDITITIHERPLWAYCLNKTNITEAVCSCRWPSPLCAAHRTSPGSPPSSPPAWSGRSPGAWWPSPPPRWPSAAPGWRRTTGGYGGPAPNTLHRQQTDRVHFRADQYAMFIACRVIVTDCLLKDKNLHHKYFVLSFFFSPDSWFDILSSLKCIY